DLSDNEVQEPSILGAALLLNGAEDKIEPASHGSPLKRRVSNLYSHHMEKYCKSLKLMLSFASETKPRCSTPWSHFSDRLELVPGREALRRSDPSGSDDCH